VLLLNNLEHKLREEETQVNSKRASFSYKFFRLFTLVLQIGVACK